MEMKIRMRGAEEAKSSRGRQNEREADQERCQRYRLRQKQRRREQNWVRSERCEQRGEWEASSDCSLGACWADRPLLRPHRQVTYLTHAAKNKKLLMCPNLQHDLHSPQHPPEFHVATQASLVKSWQVQTQEEFFHSISMTADKLQYGGATLMCHTIKHTLDNTTELLFMV